MPEFIYFIHPTREGMVQEPSAQESELLGQHFEYLKGLCEGGKVILAGPSLRPPYTGIVVFRAGDASEAEALMGADPAVEGGVFHARVSEFRCALVGG